MVQNSILPGGQKSRLTVLTLVTVAAAAVALPSGARAAACAPDRPAELRFLSEPAKPAFRHDLTRAQLGALKAPGTAGHSNAGLTHVQTGLTINPLVESFAMPDGSLCAHVRKVEVTYRMAKFLVDVAKEYQPGSCAYGETIRHEGQHVGIAQRAFAVADRAIRQRMAEQLQRDGTFIFRGTPQQAATEAGNRLMAAARPALEQFDRDTGRENAALDSPQSYAAVTARCRDW